MNNTRQSNACILLDGGLQHIVRGAGSGIVVVRPCSCACQRSSTADATCGPSTARMCSTVLQAQHGASVGGSVVSCLYAACASDHGVCLNQSHWQSFHTSATAERSGLNGEGATVIIIKRSGAALYESRSQRHRCALKGASTPAVCMYATIQRVCPQQRGCLTVAPAAAVAQFLAPCCQAQAAHTCSSPSCTHCLTW